MHGAGVKLQISTCSAIKQDLGRASGVPLFNLRWIPSGFALFL
jgi:hypothetical protein